MQPAAPRLSAALALLAASWLLPLTGLSDVAAQGVPTIGQDIAYVSGGIGVNEREQMQEMAGAYSLKLEFAEEVSRAFVSDVTVRLDRDGTTVFAVAGVGPWLLVKLPPGNYRVVAENAGETTEAEVQVPASGQAHLVLAFPES